MNNFSHDPNAEFIHAARLPSDSSACTVRHRRTIQTHSLIQDFVIYARRRRRWLRHVYAFTFWRPGRDTGQQGKQCIVLLHSFGGMEKENVSAYRLVAATWQKFTLRRSPRYSVQKAPTTTGNRKTLYRTTQANRKTKLTFGMQM